ncbi:hypothetical protein GDO86_007522 [Hymenochirus boettgeri]|uniref:Shieldin complex subunit 2 n=1 Tax=Hymenochirus boettgeri TaxID=247094 RepID=A0A8T2IZG5_9PIPI|nr:hypothetical protein GDO86_007522 [Hymenochirus boettgeri]
MSDTRTVHVFIGAPAVLRGAQVNPIAESAQTWKEQRFVFEKQQSCLQLHWAIKGTKQPDAAGCHLVHVGSANPQFVKDSNENHGNTSGHSHVLSTVTEGEQCGTTKNVSNLPFIPQCDHKTSNLEKCPDLQNSSLKDYLETSFPNTQKQHSKFETSSTNSSTSANTEFLTVLTCSQTAVYGNEDIYEQGRGIFEDTKMLHTDGDCTFPFDSIVSDENPAVHRMFQKDGEEYSNSSLELFTPVSDHAHMSCRQDINFQKETKSPELKRNNLSENVRMAVYKRQRVSKPFQNCSQSFHKKQNNTKKVKHSDESDIYVPGELQHRVQLTLKSSNPFFLLKHCFDKTKRYNVLVTVVHPCYLKEIQIKTGSSVGSLIPLASIVVLDQSEIERKVLLWRSAAFWTLALHPGDIIMLTDLMVHTDRWNDETLLQSTSRTQLSNLGNCFLLSKESSNFVDCIAVQELVKHISVSHHHLLNIQPKKIQNLNSIPYVMLDKLQPEIMVHSVLKVCGISHLIEYVYHYKGQRQNKVILTVEEVKRHTSIMVLWGASISWCAQIQPKKNHIWDFKYLYTRQNPISGDIELHTTPWSTCECLFNDDQKAVDFKKRYSHHEKSLIKQMDLLALLEDKHSGEIQVKAGISEFEFPIPGQKSIFMDYKTPLYEIVSSLNAITYSGCGKCRRELKTDENNVYEQCFLCLPYNSVKTFYRPALMTVLSGTCEIYVSVPSDVLEKIFLNITANSLDQIVSYRTTLTYGVIVADLCHALLAKTGECYLLNIRSNFSLDENSVPLHQNFYLLDFHLEI